MDFCLAGPDGDAIRQGLRPGSRCVYTFEADSRVQALHEFAHLSGDVVSEVAEEDRVPYPESSAIRQHGSLDLIGQTAYGLVAQAIAEHAYEMAKGDRDSCKLFPDVGPVYYHLSESTFEWTALTLWRLKILRPLDFDGKLNWAYFFAFDCTISDAGHVARRNWTSGPLLSKLIENFICLFNSYGGGWGFSVEPHRPFGADGDLQTVLGSLVPLGYLERSRDGFIWTELATPLMYSTGYWPIPDETTNS